MGVANLRALIAALALAAALPLGAHEIGTTQVRAQFRKDRTYQVDVTTAPQALLNKLEVAAGRHRSTGLDDRALDLALREFTSQLVGAAHISFGAQQVTPRLTILPFKTVPGAPTAVTIRLEGDVPQNAGSFAWQYDLTYAAYSLTIETPHNPPFRQWLQGDETSKPFPLDASLMLPSRLDVVRQYLALGFTHIVPLGLDHILFVLGMFLLSARIRPVLTQVTAFTVAHSITLALSILGIVAVSPRVVEPLIALSIAFVAVENVATASLKPWRIFVVFGFGLLHGLGFAGVLRDLGMPRAELVTGLVSFNVGVELGQLSVIAVAWLLVVSWAQQHTWYRHRVTIPASLAIAAAGLFWTFQRLAL